MEYSFFSVALAREPQVIFIPYKTRRGLRIAPDLSLGAYFGVSELIVVRSCEMKNRLLAVLLFSGALVLGHGSTIAQNANSQGGSSQGSSSQAGANQNSQDNADQDIDMLRKDIRYQKRQLIATNVP